MSARTFVSITDHGAVGDGKTDNRAAIQKAIDEAKAEGLAVHVPEGVFLHKGTLKIDGVDIAGAGADSVLKAVGGEHQALMLGGKGASLTNLTLDSDATARGHSGVAAKVLVKGATDFAIENVAIKNSFGAGILVQNSNQGRIVGNDVSGTNADSIHMTHGSHHILVQGNRVVNAGDDGIAVVSYRSAKSPVHDITIKGNTVVDNVWGRGITTVGGEHIDIVHNTVDGNKAGLAGIYIASEPNYDTYGVKDVRVFGNLVTDTGGTKSGHAGIMVYNKSSQVTDDVVVQGNVVLDSAKNGILVLGHGVRGAEVSYNVVKGSGEADVTTAGGPKGVSIVGNHQGPYGLVGAEAAAAPKQASAAVFDFGQAPAPAADAYAEAAPAPVVAEVFPQTVELAGVPDWSAVFGPGGSIEYL